MHGGSFDAYVRRGGQISFLDPTVVPPVMAAATRHLGLGATLPTSFHTAYHLARWLGSLDAMSKGRVAWNVVRSATDLEAQNAGLDELPPRDGRYDRADELLEACFALWNSWDAEAFVRDKQAGVLADPAKVSYADYRGRWAEAVFTIQRGAPEMRAFYDDLHARMAARGRAPHECVVPPPRSRWCWARPSRSRGSGRTTSTA